MQKKTEKQMKERAKKFIFKIGGASAVKSFEKWGKVHKRWEKKQEKFMIVQRTVDFNGQDVVKQERYTYRLPSHVCTAFADSYPDKPKGLYVYKKGNKGWESLSDRDIRHHVSSYYYSQTKEIMFPEAFSSDAFQAAQDKADLLARKATLDPVLFQEVVRQTRALTRHNEAFQDFFFKSL